MKIKSHKKVKDVAEFSSSFKICHFILQSYFLVLFTDILFFLLLYLFF